MNTRTAKTQENKAPSVAHEVSEKQSRGESGVPFLDQRPEAVAQRELQKMANNSPQAKQAAQLSSMANHHSARQPARSNSMSSDPIQLVRIKLRDEDKELMDELRQVPVNQDREQAVEAPAGLSDLDGLVQIGASEDIVLEGHGNTNGEGETHGQGGWTARALAQFANRVPKPENWSGSIILLGCSTGGITEEVSKEYYRLTKKAVTVTGTLKNIKVGKNSEGTNFIGTDWDRYPEGERPEDLAIIRKVEKGMEDFHELCVMRLSEIQKDMGKTTDNASVVIPYDLGTLELDAWKIMPMDANLPKYYWIERLNIHTSFNKLLKVITDDAEVVVGRILRVKDKQKGIIAIRGNLLDAFQEFRTGYDKTYLSLIQKIHGLGLKPIDLSKPDQVKKSRMEESSKLGGMLGEVWTDKSGL